MIFIKEIKNNLKAHWQIIFYVLVLTAILSFVFIFVNPRGQVNLEKGDISNVVVRAPQTVYFESLSKTNEARNEAVSLVGNVYTLDNSAILRQEEIAEGILDRIGLIIGDSSLSLEDKKSNIQIILQGKIGGEELTSVAKENSSSWTKIKSEVLKVLNNVHLKSKINPDNIEEVKKQFASEISGRFSSADTNKIVKLSEALLIPNTVLDLAETERFKEVEREKVTPIYYQVRAGEIVVHKGEKVDDLIIEKLDALKLKGSLLSDIQRSIGIVIFVGLLSVLMTLYFLFYTKSRLPKYELLFLVLILTVLVVLGGKLLIPFKAIVAYAFPLVSFPAILAFFVNRRSAILYSVIASLLFGFAVANSYEIMVVQLVGAICGVILMYRLQRVVDLFRIGVILFLINLILSASFHLIFSAFNIEKFGQLIISSIVYAVSAVFIVLGGSYIAGLVFKSATFIQLVDLGSPSQSLIKRLSLEVPGTYQHCIAVANFSEAAARAIGEDPLLSRVASFYHDIGKLENPGMFIENQNDGESIHQSIADNEKSSKYIKRHVEDGIKIAKKVRLPREITNIIMEHHGTTVVRSFYEKARKASDKVQKEHFSYHGPIPTSKISGIIMLADSLEAAIRQKRMNLTEKDFIKLVDSVFSSKISQGQLDDSELTFKDSMKIKKAFYDSFKAVFHKR